MRTLKLFVLAFLVIALVWTARLTRVAEGQDIEPSDTKTPTTFSVDSSEAPTGFDDKTNGVTNQATFNADKDIFEEREFIADGLGPVFNAQACSECHQTPVTGAASQIGELRAGHFNAQIS